MMDSLFNKTSTYEFFCVFISGMIMLVITFFVFPDLFFVFDIFENVNEWIVLIVCLLIGYIVGIVLEELGVCFEKICNILGNDACHSFLNDDNGIIKNGIELQEYRKYAIAILNEKNEFYNGDCFTKEQCCYIYYYCRKKIESKPLGKKVNLIRALYGMTRSLVAGILLILLIIFVVSIFRPMYSLILIIEFIVLFLILLLMVRRCRRFSRLKVREVLKYFSM